MSPVAALPEPAHADLDSMLSRKFGKEVANYFSGPSSPLHAPRTVSELTPSRLAAQQSLVPPQ